MIDIRRLKNIVSDAFDEHPLHYSSIDVLSENPAVKIKCDSRAANKQNKETHGSDSPAETLKREKQLVKKNGVNLVDDFENYTNNKNKDTDGAKSLFGESPELDEQSLREDIDMLMQALEDAVETLDAVAASSKRCDCNSFGIVQQAMNQNNGFALEGILGKNYRKRLKIKEEGIEESMDIFGLGSSREYKAALDVLSGVMSRRADPRHDIYYYAAHIARSYHGVDGKKLAELYLKQKQKVAEGASVPYVVTYETDKQYTKIVYAVTAERAMDEVEDMSLPKGFRIIDARLATDEDLKND